MENKGKTNSGSDKKKSHDFSLTVFEISWLIRVSISSRKVKSGNPFVYVKLPKWHLSCHAPFRDVINVFFLRFCFLKTLSKAKVCYANIQRKCHLDFPLKRPIRFIGWH